MQDTNIRLSPKEEALKKEIITKLSAHFGRTAEEATPKMIYTAAALTVRDRIMKKFTKRTEHRYDGKKLYYLSFEFLMGRLFSVNILNLTETKTYKNVLSSMGYDMASLKETENDAGLGNGGLGRLAACFIDSLATLDLPACGSTIRYEYGLFRQKIVDGYQIEMPDPWLEDGNVWEIPRVEETVEVRFGGRVYTEWYEGRCYARYENAHTVLAIPYDVPIVGYDSKTVNKLRLWAAESRDDINMEEFNSGRYLKAQQDKHFAEVISKVLYPEDNHAEGKELRLRQQYFLVSATVQWIVAEHEKNFGCRWDILPEKAVIHINDTHPTLAIPELMRILMDDKGLSWEEAWGITRRTFAYTNHTIMSEALEKWDLSLFRRLLPRIFMIVEEMDSRLKKYLEAVYPNDPKKHKYMAVIADEKVYMANICLYTCFAVNGVSRLHTDILRNDIFADYCRLDPERFHSITNGITFRRWIADANRELYGLISEKIGTKWLKNYKELEKLKAYADDNDFLARFSDIRHNNKIRLAEYIKEHNGIEIDPSSIFDVQAKRLHEYKRQLMNVLHIMAEYNRLIENPSADFFPKTYIFGAKAAPGYTRAKLIIKLITSVAEKINSDERLGGRLKVVFIENYGVSIAEMLVSAADISEQISTAGKEASGTGNMKFMLNGAITIGTLDGANVEMAQAAGAENIFIFGLKSDEVAARLKYNNSAEVKEIYLHNAVLRRVLEQLINGEFSPENPQMFRDLYHSLLFGDYADPDKYMVLRDFEDYCAVCEKMHKLYENRAEWTKKAVINIASAGYFSSDRAVTEYNEKIWHLDKMK